MQVSVSGRLVPAWLRLHDTLILRLNRESWPILESSRELTGFSERRLRRARRSLRVDPNGQRYWSSDHQNHEGHEQRDAGRAGKRDQGLNESVLPELGATPL